MSETAEQLQPKHSPLHHLYVSAGVSLQNIDGWLVPTHFGDFEQEYAAVRKVGAGIFDLSPRGRMRVTGTEAVQFLNGLITNDMKTLAVNHWMPAVFPNAQGRLLANVRVMRLADEQTTKGASPTFLIDTEAATHERVAQTISRFNLAGDFHVTDITSSTACISMQGKSAADMVRELFSKGEPRESLELSELEWKGSKLILVHANHAGEDGFDIIVEATTATEIWQALLSMGAIPVGEKTLEVLRIEAGESKFGIDMDESFVVSETNLDDAISFTKGCYIGQEIIARIKYRGHVAKKITGLMLDSPTHIGAKVFSAEDKEVGSISSITFSPELQKWVALAVIKYQYLSAGTELRVVLGSQPIGAIVTDLPFIQRS